MDYLVKHEYIDPETANLKRKDLHLSQSLPEATLRHLVASHSGVSNVVTFNCLAKAEVALDEQFTAFKHDLQSECVRVYKNELESLLYPMFCHIYLELISSGHKTPAHRFMSKHQGLFQGKREERSMVETLQLVFNVADIDKDEVRLFRESKYLVSLSVGAFEYLMRYLKSHDHTGLLYLLERFVDVSVCDDGGRGPAGGDDDEWRKKMKDAREKLDDLATESEELEVKTDPKVEGLLSFTPSSGHEPNLMALKEVIGLVRDLPPSPPSVQVFQVSGGKSSLPDVTTADLSLTGNALALGCEDSSIKIFPTDHRGILAGGGSGDRPFGHRRIRLHCDPENDSTSFLSKHPTNSRIFRGHSSSVSGLSFFSDPNYFVSASEDKSLRLWHLDQGSNIAIYKGHNYQVLTVTTSSAVDSGFFVSGSLDRTCRLWTTDRVYPLRTLVGHNLAVEIAEFHPNQTYFATGSADKTVRLWTINDGKFVRLFQGHRAGIYALAFSPNGQFLASAGEDRRIRIWDIAQGTSLKELKGHVDVVTSLSFSPDSSMLASGSQDGSIRIWDVSKGLAAANSLVDQPSDLLVHHPSATASSMTHPPSSSTTSQPSPSVIHHLTFGKTNTLYAVVATVDHQSQHHSKNSH